MTEHKHEPQPRLGNDKLAMLRKLFAEQAEKGATVFHQAHAEELLALADEVISARASSEITPKPILAAVRCMVERIRQGVPIDALDPDFIVIEAMLDMSPRRPLTEAEQAEEAANRG